jgi:hypothetical protein
MGRTKSASDPNSRNGYNLTGSIAMKMTNIPLISTAYVDMVNRSQIYSGGRYSTSTLIKHAGVGATAPQFV